LCGYTLFDWSLATSSLASVGVGGHTNGTVGIGTGTGTVILNSVIDDIVDIGGYDYVKDDRHV
jgi:hypothetical protein